MTKTILPVFLVMCVAMQQGFAQQGIQRPNMAVNDAGRTMSREASFSGTNANSYPQPNETRSRTTSQPVNYQPQSAQPDISKSEYEYQKRGNYSTFYDNSTRNYRQSVANSAGNSGNYGGGAGSGSRTRGNVKSDTPDVAAIMAERAKYARLTQSDIYYDYWYIYTGAGMCNCNRMTQRDALYNWYKCYRSSYRSSMFGGSASIAAVQPEPIGNDALFTSRPGYIVYNDDTSGGWIVLSEDAVFFTGETKRKIPYSRKISYNDMGLNTVVIVDDKRNKLHLTRVNDDDRILSRVLHNGRLVVYDNVYSFDKGQYDKNKLKVAYGDKKRQPAVILDPYMRMVKVVNRAYGLDLKPDDYNWNSLMDRVSELD